MTYTDVINYSFHSCIHIGLFQIIVYMKEINENGVSNIDCKNLILVFVSVSLLYYRIKLHIVYGNIVFYNLFPSDGVVIFILHNTMI